MFYSVLAAADDGRRPWADPATHTKTLSLSQDTQNHSVVLNNKWMHRCNREKKNPRDGSKNGCRVRNTMSTKVNVLINLKYFFQFVSKQF